MRSHILAVAANGGSDGNNPDGSNRKRPSHGISASPVPRPFPTGQYKVPKHSVRRCTISRPGTLMGGSEGRCGSDWLIAAASALVRICERCTANHVADLAFGTCLRLYCDLRLTSSHDRKRGDRMYGRPETRRKECAADHGS
jgi:hypothetical protein